MTASGGEFLERARWRLRVRDDLSRCALAELFATALFVWAGTSVVAQATLSRGRASGHTSVTLGWGIAAALATLAAHRTSGGHLNPAISFFYLSARQISTARFVIYAVAQLAGAFTGAALTYLVYYDAINAFEGGARSVNGPTSTAHIFAVYPTNPQLGLFEGVVEQVFGAAFLTASLAAVADRRNHVPLHAQPPLVGASYALIAAAFGWQSGGVAVNPARDFGARLFSALGGGYGLRAFSQRSYAWFTIPLLAPMAGALLGGWTYLLTIGLHVPNEIDDLEEKVRKIQQHANNSDRISENKSAAETKVTSNNLLYNNDNNCNSVVLLMRKSRKNSHHYENNNDAVHKTSDTSSSGIVNRVPRTISATRVALDDSIIYVGKDTEAATTETAEPHWQYNDLFADGNYVDLSEQKQ